MEKKNKIDRVIKEVFVVVILLLFFGLLISVLSNASRVACYNEALSTYSSYNQSFLATSSSNLLSPLGTGILTSSITTPNQTWINFDGVNDYVNLTISGYSTISFWYKTSTQSSWTNLINSSGTIYINGSASAITIYPIYQNGLILQIGYNGTYFNGSIDEIRTYNFNLNSTQATEIYNEGR
jgi:hypothetical protein